MMKVTIKTFEWITVGVALLSMGSLYFQVLRMPMMAAMMLLVCIFWIVQNPKISRYNLSIYASITVAFLITSFVNYYNGFHINDLIIWIVQVFLILVMESNMSFKQFIKLFTILMLFEAAISLLCFLWGDILGMPLPLMHLEYNSANGFYCAPYYTLGWANIPVFHRNAGIFNEPGSHQIFLNFALMFLLNDDEHFHFNVWKYRIALIILITTILTTMSTTGYLCLGVVIISTVMKKKGSGPKGKTIFLALFLVVVLYIVEMRTGVIQTKIGGRYAGGSFMTRQNDLMAGYSIAYNNFWFGIGMFSERASEILAGYGVKNISSGMGLFAARNGLVITALWLFAMWKKIKHYFNYGNMFVLCFFIFYLMCVNSEGLFANTLLLAFFGRWKEDSYYSKTFSMRA